MTLFIRLVDGEPSGDPILEQNLRQIFPNTSFPQYFTADAVEPMGYGLYDFSSQPNLGRYEKAVEVPPVRSAEGIWKQTWSIVQMDSPEKADVDAIQAALVRSQREIKLAETDWVVLKCYEAGQPVPEEIKSVRQKLRDITDHENFPYLNDGDWPAKP